MHPLYKLQHGYGKQAALLRTRGAMAAMAIKTAKPVASCTQAAVTHVNMPSITCSMGKTVGIAPSKTGDLVEVQEKHSNRLRQKRLDTSASKFQQ